MNNRWAKGELIFENIKAGLQLSVQRAKVPGGWLVVVCPLTSFESMWVTFYPDPDHIWDGSSLQGDG